MSTPLILLDQDGPLADFDAALNRVLVDLGHDAESLVATEWDYTNDVTRRFGPEAASALDLARLAPGFFRVPGGRVHCTQLGQPNVRIRQALVDRTALPHAQRAGHHHDRQDVGAW